MSQVKENHHMLNNLAILRISANLKQRWFGLLPIFIYTHFTSVSCLENIVCVHRPSVKIPLTLCFVCLVKSHLIGFHGIVKSIVGTGWILIILKFAGEDTAVVWNVSSWFPPFWFAEAKISQAFFEGEIPFYPMAHTSSHHSLGLNHHLKLFYRVIPPFFLVKSPVWWWKTC